MDNINNFKYLFKKISNIKGVGKKTSVILNKKKIVLRNKGNIKQTILIKISFSALFNF